MEKLFRVIKERSYITVSGGVVPTPLAAAPLSSVTHDKKKDIDERRDVKEKEKEKREDVKKKITVNQGEKEKEQQKVGSIIGIHRSIKESNFSPSDHDGTMLLNARRACGFFSRSVWKDMFSTGL